MLIVIQGLWNALIAGCFFSVRLLKCIPTKGHVRLSKADVFSGFVCFGWRNWLSPLQADVSDTVIDLKLDIKGDVIVFESHTASEFCSCYHSLLLPNIGVWANLQATWVIYCDTPASFDPSSLLPTCATHCRCTHVMLRDLSHCSSCGPPPPWENGICTKSQVGDPAWAELLEITAQPLHNFHQKLSDET